MKDVTSLSDIVENFMSEHNFEKTDELVEYIESESDFIEEVLGIFGDLLTNISEKKLLTAIINSAEVDKDNYSKLVRILTWILASRTEAEDFCNYYRMMMSVDKTE